MLIILLWRMVNSSLNLPLIPFAFHCINHRQFVGVGAVSGPWLISISPHTEAEVGASVPAMAAPPPKRRFDE